MKKRIEKEKRIVLLMIRIYCRAKHKHSDGLCPECESLALYACQRLERCKFGEQKTSCQRCPIHCYKQERKEEIKKVMRYAGPRMVWRHPLTALWHLMH
uniref:nitrous oxide-stimulated promoter family protein n=1 Tax=Alloprevotella sp. TaxID=1872471 RepID=UPI0040287ADB